jgi:Flp pilus assembly protein TadD
VQLGRDATSYGCAVNLFVGIALAIVLGVLLGVLLARLRARRRNATSAPKDVAGLLRTYRHGDYAAVVEAAPDVAAGMDSVADAAWRSRLELVWGHSLFQLDRFDESIMHLQRGLDEGSGPHEAEARFRHCLGFAQQQTGRMREARRTYGSLLDDPDLDPAVRTGVEKHLAQLNGPPEGAAGTDAPR